MNHNRAVETVVSALVREVETLREVVVHLDLPATVGKVFELAMGSPNAPRAELTGRGWHLRDSLEVTRDPWVYQRITETYMLDPEMRDRIARLNPKASARVANRLIEASDRQFWAPDAATLAALHAASDDLEDRLEGITAVAA